MVFLRNIQSLHSTLQPNEEMRLFFKSGNSTKIKFESELKVKGGDLEISTPFGDANEKCKIVLIDCAEVEKISLIRRMVK